MRELHPLGTARRFLGRSLPADAPPDRRGEIPAELLAEERIPELDEVLLWQAWEIARFASPEDRRLALFLGAALLVAERKGSTRLSLEPSALEKALVEVGVPEGERRAVEAFLEGENPLVGEGRPLVVEGGALYSRRNLQLEAGVAERLAQRLGRGAPQGDPEVEKAIASLALHPAKTGAFDLLLNEEQQEAVRRAARLPLTVVSGGPGTGKTQIVVSILRVLARLGVAPEAIALAAPTGKAAHRLRESIQKTLDSLDPPAPEDRPLLEGELEPKTLHRLLGYRPSARRFRHHEENPLEEEVVIVDEASMIDLGLMDRLLRALRPDARLILLGDADQLPSVGAGAVFRDLVPLGASSVEDPRRGASIRLLQSYRMDPKDPAGRAILLAAQGIRQGESGAAEAIVARKSAGDLLFEGVEGVPAEELLTFCERWYRERLASWEEYGRLIRRAWQAEEGRFEEEESLRLLFAHYERSRILCLTRVLETGSDAVNARLHRIHVEAIGGEPGARVAPGEPLMMQRNDYARGLYNGDQGIALWVRERVYGRASLRAVFPVGEGYRSFPLDLASGFETSWAMTVHKSQGSEFDAAALILPAAEIPLLTREALYTALTRARHSVVVVGDPSIFARGIARPLERETGLVERLLGEP